MTYWHTSGRPARRIATARLELVPATRELTLAALEGSGALAASLGAVVPSSWPPEFLDTDALKYSLARITESQHNVGWGLHFVVLIVTDADRTLIGSAGYKGPPSADGTVEIGYGIVRDHRRRGYASEAVRGLLGRAFEVPGVTRVIAETYPHLAGSIGVLRTCGFRLVDGGSEPGVMRLEVRRKTFEKHITLDRG
ncbi:MAG: hypothetical protein NVS4B3_28730 [Gemmatimonadaceae bacterium]